MTLKCSHPGCDNGVVRDCCGDPLTKCYIHYKEAINPVTPPKSTEPNDVWETVRSGGIPSSHYATNTLTRREEFTKAALQGLCANPAEQLIRSSYEEMAIIAIDQADALLAELAKEKQG